MTTLIESLERQIKRLESLHGSDDPFVKRLKEQLRALKANGEKSTQDVYLMQAVPPPKRAPPAPDSAVSDPNRDETEEDAKIVQDRRRFRALHGSNASPTPTPDSSK